MQSTSGWSQTTYEEADKACHIYHSLNQALMAYPTGWVPHAKLTAVRIGILRTSKLLHLSDPTPKAPPSDPRNRILRA